MEEQENEKFWCSENLDRGIGVARIFVRGAGLLLGGWWRCWNWEEFAFSFAAIVLGRKERAGPGNGVRIVTKILLSLSPPTPALYYTAAANEKSRIGLFLL